MISLKITGNESIDEVMINGIVYAAKQTQQETRKEAIENIWVMLKEIPPLEIEGYGFKLLNRRQVLGNVNELFVKASKES